MIARQWILLALCLISVRAEPGDCNTMCTKEYDPVCTGPVSGCGRLQTFGNPCEFEVYMCEHPELAYNIKYRGVCYPREGENPNPDDPPPSPTEQPCQGEGCTQPATSPLPPSPASCAQRPNEVYIDGGSPCQTECKTLFKPCDIRTFAPVKACYCKDGYARDKDDVCIPINSSKCQDTCDAN